MKTNTKKKYPLPETHEGAPAHRINPEQQLRRSVLACLLFEDEFYEDGQSVAARIASTIPLVKPEKVAAIAIEARSKGNLRHVPLLIVRAMAALPSHKHLVAETLAQVIQRADELTEFLAIYWKDGKQKLSAQVKKGLAAAFTKFNAFQLAKYNRDGAVKLRDVLFLSHAKPKDEEQASIWKKLIDGTLESPDTWEVSLSSGADKLESWSRLLAENKLGGLALLRNLRNMQQAGVDKKVIREALAEMKTDRILPFRFLAAATHAPDMEPELEIAMLKSLAVHDKLQGETVLLVDVSGSMDASLSAKSDLQRLDAATGLAILLREICESVTIATFSNQVVQVPPRRGFALRDVIVKSQPHGGTYLGQALTTIQAKLSYDRIIVITDEQSHDRVPAPQGKGYVINVASFRNGVGYGPWTHIDGFSEAIVNYILALENAQ